MNGRELARALGVQEKKMYDWVKRGWLKPQHVPTGRWSGEELFFNEEEQRVARTMVELVKCGMYPDGAHRMARGNVGSLHRLLSALAAGPQVVEMRWRLNGDGRERMGVMGVAGQSQGELAVGGESEPCI